MPYIVNIHYLRHADESNWLLMNPRMGIMQRNNNANETVADQVQVIFLF